MDYEALLAFLYGLRHHSASYGIDRMRALDHHLRAPHTHFPIIHVAGTNGKGSVCAILESIFRKAGYKTGLFTSPHLIHVEERIRLNAIPIPRHDLIAYTLKLQKIIQELYQSSSDLHPSFFEFINAIAFQYFKDQNVDIAFVEVGLGGEKDSTNIVSPILSLITSISLDHQEILGSSIHQIAQAKAGIIKPNTPVITGRLPKEAQEIIQSIADQQGAPLTSVQTAFGSDLQNYPTPAIPGSCQKINAALAITAIQKLQHQFSISPSHISQGLETVNWPARWQHIPSRENADLYLDTSHNSEGALNLESQLKSLKRSTPGPITIAFGALGPDRAKSLGESLAPFASTLLPTTFNHTRSCTAQDLIAGISKASHASARCCNLEELTSAYQASSPDEIFVITGSIYLVGQFMSALDIPVQFT